MKSVNQSKNLVFLSEGNFAVVSEEEWLKIYLEKISWNMRSLMRQADILETAMLEINNQNVASKRPAGNRQEPLHCKYIANQSKK